MRSYIFTENERRIIRKFLAGKADRKDPRLMVIFSRLKSFKNLAGDVELYLRLKTSLAEPKST